MKLLHNHNQQSAGRAPAKVELHNTPHTDVKVVAYPIVVRRSSVVSQSDKLPKEKKYRKILIFSTTQRRI